MTFSLHTGERLTIGLRRIYQAQLESAHQSLANDGRLTDKDIHEARKSIKRARATLRLMRPALANKAYEKANVMLRDVARPLTQVRDAKILLDSLDALRDHYGEAIENLPTDDLEQALQMQRARARREMTAASDTVAQLRATLRGLQAETRQWRFKSEGWDLLGASLRRVYRSARRAHTTVCEARSDERLHEWRKQVKHLWHSLQILTPLRPGRFGEMADQAHKLTEYLGHDHDLAILRKQLEMATIDEDTSEVLEALIDRRRADLQDRAFAVGERLLERRPKRFVRPFRRAWRLWHASVASAPAALPTEPRAPRTRTRDSMTIPSHLH